MSRPLRASEINEPNPFGNITYQYIHAAFGPSRILTPPRTKMAADDGRAVDDGCREHGPEKDFVTNHSGYVIIVADRNQKLSPLPPPPFLLPRTTKSRLRAIHPATTTPLPRVDVRDIILDFITMIHPRILSLEISRTTRPWWIDLIAPPTLQRGRKIIRPSRLIAARRCNRHRADQDTVNRSADDDVCSERCWQQQNPSDVRGAGSHSAAQYGVMCLRSLSAQVNWCTRCTLLTRVG